MPLQLSSKRSGGSHPDALGVRICALATSGCTLRRLSLSLLCDHASPGSRANHGPQPRSVPVPGLAGRAYFRELGRFVSRARAPAGHEVGGLARRTRRRERALCPPSLRPTFPLPTRL